MSIKLMDAAAIAVACTSIRKNSTELQELIHQAAVSVLAHVRDHGDTTLAVRLVESMSSGMRRGALADWFNHFSNRKLKLTADKKTGQWAAKLDRDRSPEDFDIESASEVDYGEFSPEIRKSAVTLQKLIGAITKFTKDEKLPDGSPKNPPDVVRGAQKALAAIVA